MAGLWDGVKRAAISGAAKAAVGAEQAVRRLDLQRRIAERQAAADAECAAIGRLVIAAVRAGAEPPAGAARHIEEVEAAEVDVERLRAELAALGR